MERMRKLNLSLFHWSEIINLGILCFYYDVIDHVFFFIYGIVLLGVGAWKIFARISQVSRFENIEYSVQRCSLLSYIIFFSEFSLIFLCYTEISMFLPFVCTIVFIPLIIFFEEKINVSVVVPLFFFALLALAAAFMAKSFNITTELVKITFVLGLLWLFDYKESYLGGFFILLAGCVLLFVNGEAGSCFILLLGYDVFCLFSNKSKVSKAALIITILCVIMWFLIIFVTPLYDLMYDMVTKICGSHEHIREQIHNFMSRTFFHYSSTDQLPLLHSLINGQNIINKLTCTFSPAEYTEIVKYENGASTSSADYCFSLVLYFLGPISACLLFFSSVYVYISSTIRNFNNRYRIIPIVLCSQTIIHVLGNMMILPFTGIPYPFLSFGNANLIINFVMIFVLAHAELKEGC